MPREIRAKKPAFLAGHLTSRAERLGRALNPDDYVFVEVNGRPLNVHWFRQHVVRPALRARRAPVEPTLSRPLTAEAR